MKNEKLSSKPVEKLLLLSVALVIVSLIATADVRDTSSDPRYSLLVSQTIFRYGTIKLDSYVEIPGFLNNLIIKEKNGHYYDMFPLGTPIFSIPFVSIANLLGMDMLFDARHVQIAISAILGAVVFVILYKISRYYLSYAASAVIASVSFLGSSLISTMGSALWSHNFSVLFVSLSLLLMAKKESGNTDSLNPYLLGFLIFSAYLCRPTAAVFIVSVLGYVLLRERKAFIKLVVTVVLLFTLFIIFSLIEFGELLPFYYRPNRLGSNTFFTAVYGNTLSPGRGVFIFSPFFLLSAIGSIFYFQKLKRNALFLFALIWYILHLLTISQFPKWWGGWCYGSRLQTEAIPALAIITILLWKTIGKKAKKTIVVVFVIFGICGVLINSIQGLYNTTVQTWNAIPNVDEYPEYVLNWKYPQFFANEKMLIKRYFEFKAKQ